MALFLIYLMILFIDLKHFIIPDILNYGIIVLAIIKNFLPNLDLIFTQDIKLSLAGGIVGYLSIWGKRNGRLKLAYFWVNDKYKHWQNCQSTIQK